MAYIIVDGVKKEATVDFLMKLRKEAVDNSKMIRAAAFVELRKERDLRLLWTDHKMLPDCPSNKDAWIAYRAALRDLPSVTNDPTRPVWPAVPTG